MAKTTAQTSGAAAARTPQPAASRLATACTAGIEACWLTALVVSALFFNTHSTRIFEPDKLAVVRTLALIVAALAATRAFDAGWNPIRQKFPKPTTATVRTWLVSNPLPAAALLYLLLAVISTAFSISPSQSLWGSYARAQGLYSLLAYALLALAAHSQIRTMRQLWRLIDTLIYVSIPMSFYGIMQRFGLDTYQWQQFFTQTRITSTLGNPIFVGGFLVPIIPLTAAALLHAGHLLRTARPRTSAHWLRTAIYAVSIPLQLLALWYTGSRGPVLAVVPGLMLAGLVLLAVTGRRSLVAMLTAAALASVVFIALLNIPRGPLEHLRDADTTLGRLGHLLDGSRDSPASTRQRVLIWEGVLQAVLPHAPVAFSTGGSDRWNFIRPVVGYGLETLTFVFQQFFPPEFAQLDRWRAISQQGEGTTIVLTYSPTAPDRSHNEFFDALVFGGVLGALAYLLLFAIAIYWLYGIAGLLPNQNAKRIYWLLAVSGAIGGAVAVRLALGLQYVGVGLPLGMLAGTGLYLLGIAGLHRIPSPASTDVPKLLVCAGIVGALTAHFVDLHFGIPTGATRLVLWLLLASAAVLPQLTTPAQPTHADHAPAKEANTRAKTTAATKEPPTWLTQALVPTTVLITLVYILILNPEHAQTSAEILARSFGGSATAAALQPFAMAALVLCTWLTGSLLFAISDNTKLNLDTFLKIAATSAASALLFGLLHVTRLAATARFPAADPEGTVRTVRSIGAVYTHYNIWLIALCLLLPYFAAATTRARSHQPAGWIALGTTAVLTFFTAANTNFALIFADTFHHVALPFQSNNQYPTTIRLLEEAMALAPQEPYFPLYLGNTLLEQSRKLSDEPAQTAAIQRAMGLYKHAQELEPLHPDATTGLARLLSYWAEMAPAGQVRTTRATEAAQYFELASIASPTNVLTLNEWAMLDLRMLNKLDGAEVRLQRSLALDDQYDLTYLLLGDLHMKRADTSPETAHAEYTAAIEFYKRGAVIRTSFPMLVALGRANRLAGNPLAAILAYHQAIAAAPAKTDLAGIRNTIVSQYEAVGITPAEQAKLAADLAPSGTADAPQQKLIDTLLLGRSLLTADRETASKQFDMADKLATDTPQHLVISTFIAQSYSQFADVSALQQAAAAYNAALGHAAGEAYTALRQQRSVLFATLITAQQELSTAQLTAGEPQKAIDGMRSTLSLDLSTTQRVQVLKLSATLYLAAPASIQIPELQRPLANVTAIQQAAAAYTEALAYADEPEYSALLEQLRNLTARLLDAQETLASAQLAAGEPQKAIDGMRSTLSVEISANQRARILQTLAAAHLVMPAANNLEEADANLAEALIFANVNDQASLQQMRDNVRQQILERERTKGAAQLAAGDFTGAETSFRAALRYSAGEPQHTQLKQMISNALAGPATAPALTAASNELEQAWLQAPIELQPEILSQQSKWMLAFTALGQPAPAELAEKHAAYPVRAASPRYLQKIAIADQLASTAPQLAIEALATAITLAPAAEDRARLYTKSAALRANIGDIPNLRLALGEIDAALTSSTTDNRTALQTLRRNYLGQLVTASLAAATALAQQGFTDDAITLLTDALASGTSGADAARLNLARATFALGAGHPESTARAWTSATTALTTAADDQRPAIFDLIKTIRNTLEANSTAAAERHLANGDFASASTDYQRALELSHSRSDRLRIKLLLASALASSNQFTSLEAALREASSAASIANFTELAPITALVASLTAERDARIAELGVNPNAPFPADAPPEAQRAGWEALAAGAISSNDPELMSRAYSNLAELAETGPARSAYFQSLTTLLMKQPALRWLEAAQTSIDQARTYGDTPQQAALATQQAQLHGTLLAAYELSASAHSQISEWDAARADLQKALAHATDRQQRSAINLKLASIAPELKNGITLGAACADAKTAMQYSAAANFDALTVKRDAVCGRFVNQRVETAAALAAANQPALGAQVLAPALGAATTASQRTTLFVQLAQNSEGTQTTASMRDTASYWEQAIRSTSAAETLPYQTRLAGATKKLNDALRSLAEEPSAVGVPTPGAAAIITALQVDASSAIAAGNYAAAEGSLTAAIAISPANQSPALQRALLQLRTNAHAKLLATAVLAAKSDLTGAADNFAAAIAFAPDAPARAAAALQAAKVLANSPAEPIVARALDFLNQGSPYFSASENATAATLRAALLQKLFVGAQTTAQAALNAADYAEAQAQGQRALGYTDNGPQRASTLLLLADAAHRAGDNAAARDFAKRAMRHAAANQLEAVRTLIAQLPPA
ncbi:MAG: hypothetical protein DWI64_05590 [Chloroflexi bacterium]|nr:MAG: hypothetical protein DWI64_05590 [Chloroflexota bacterium]